MTTTLLVLGFWTAVNMLITTLCLDELRTLRRRLLRVEDTHPTPVLTLVEGDAS